jgi:DNA invertase Pin-like site-specific DNA recombinase
MRVALYVRVSTDRQQQAQTIEQQVTQLQSYVAARDGWTVAEEHVFRDDGYSGAKLDRPGLDALRDQAARAAFDVVVVTAPDRLARNFVHQMVVLEELERRGVRVVFIDRPLTDDPHEQLVTQIRGAVAEYERTLIADRMRRGRQARLRSGQLLPWTRAPYGFRLHPERPRDPAAVQVDPSACDHPGTPSWTPPHWTCKQRSPVHWRSPCRSTHPGSWTPPSSCSSPAVASSRSASAWTVPAVAGSSWNWSTPPPASPTSPLWTRRSPRRDGCATSAPATT